MKNKLTDLNDHLFAEMERLSDEDLKGSDLKEEIERAKAITCVSMSIIHNAKIVLDAAKARMEYTSDEVVIPEMLGEGK